MTFQIDTPPELPRKRRTAANFNSSAFKLRLVMLMGCLLLILVMMQEARNPENWEWMGFEKKGEVAGGQLEPKDVNPENKTDAQSNPERQGQVFEKKAGELDSEFIDRLNLSSGDNEYPIQARLFWERLLARLGTERRAKLFQLTRLSRTGAIADEAIRADLESLVSLVDEQRNRFETKLLDSISYLEDNGQKEKLNQQLFEAKAIWREKILPAWKSVVAGEEITVSQLLAMDRLQAIYDEFAFALVEDGAALNRAVEGPASLRVWEKALALRSPEAEVVSLIQLTGQPAVYRGKAVAIKGWVRRAVAKSFRENELGLNHIYVLWVRPSDSNSSPFCIYTQELPEGFQPIGNAMVTMNESVEVSGVFHKIRSYVTEEGSVLSCPLIYSKTFQWDPEKAVVAEASGWEPNTLTLIAFLVGMPLVATFIAYFVYRSSRFRQFEPGSTAQSRIERSLDRLKENSDVQTDLEKVQQLAEQEGTS